MRLVVPARPWSLWGPAVSEQLPLQHAGSRSPVNSTLMAWPRQSTSRIAARPAWSTTRRVARSRPALCRTHSAGSLGPGRRLRRRTDRSPGARTGPTCDLRHRRARPARGSHSGDALRRPAAPVSATNRGTRCCSAMFCTTPRPGPHASRGRARGSALHRDQGSHRRRPLARPTLRFMDFVGNAPHGVALPYNYLDARGMATVISHLACAWLTAASWPLSLVGRSRFWPLAALHGQPLVRSRLATTHEWISGHFVVPASAPLLVAMASVSRCRVLRRCSGRCFPPPMRHSGGCAGTRHSRRVRLPPGRRHLCAQEAGQSPLHRTLSSSNRPTYW